MIVSEKSADEIWYDKPITRSANDGPTINSVGWLINLDLRRWIEIRFRTIEAVPVGIDINTKRQIPYQSDIRAASVGVIIASHSIDDFSQHSGSRTLSDFSQRVQDSTISLLKAHKLFEIGDLPSETPGGYS